MGINREYKATLFSELFSDSHHLRELYNAIADTDYGEETPVEINTLENVFFNDLKNDVSFTIGGKYVVLLEHQSTINSNMPLRCLMYIARVYEKITDDRAVYQENLLKIPTPEFIVLYNGVKAYPSEKVLRLSDAYIAADESLQKFGSLDLTVRVVNINPGHNDGLLQKSETLKGYSAFVEHVRHKQRCGANLRDAVGKSIAWGIEQGILSAFLAEHGSEVNNMLMTEFNIDIAKEVWQEEAREDGREEGREEGRAQAYLEAEEKWQNVVAVKDTELAEKDAEIAQLRARLEEKQ